MQGINQPPGTVENASLDNVTNIEPLAWRSRIRFGIIRLPERFDYVTKGTSVCSRQSSTSIFTSTIFDYLGYPQLFATNRYSIPWSLPILRYALSLLRR